MIKMQKFDVKRYYRLSNNKIVDTSVILPHTECYFEKGGSLFAEQLDGSEVNLGKIIESGDSIKTNIN